MSPISKYKIGDKASISKKIIDENIRLYAQATGDDNPLHLDDDFAKESIFKGRIAHGIYIASLISSVIANKLPGNGAIYLSQNLKFILPVRLGDEVTAEVEVIGIDDKKNRLTLKTTCYNQYKDPVIIGEAVVIPQKLQ